MSTITASKVACNCIVTAHIKRIDMSNDIPQSAEQRLREKKSLELKGFPMVIGQAVSPYIGKKFNDQFIVERQGNGKNASRRIFSVPVSNTDTKNSAFVDPDYSLESGLAEIFAALRLQPYPEDLVKALKPKTQAPSSTPNSDSAPKPRGFGS